MSNINQLVLELFDNEYETFFRLKLKQWGVESPEDLSTEDKKKFFNEVDKQWKADHERD
jgi:hypothetical protein